MEVESSDAKLEESGTAIAPPHYSNFLHLPEQSTKRNKVSGEPIVDYSQSQALTTDGHVDALKSIVERKFKIAQERREKLKERDLNKKEKEIANQKKAKEKALLKAAKDKQARKKDVERGKKRGKENRQITPSCR